jgi:hypothetical protein
MGNLHCRNLNSHSARPFLRGTLTVVAVLVLQEFRAQV